MNKNLPKHRYILGILAVVPLIVGFGAYALASAEGPPAAISAAATLTMIAPAGAQPPGVPFQFTSNLSALTVTASAPAWAGYSFELAYDGSVIEIDSVVPTLCSPMNVWGDPALVPHVSTGCIGQQGTSTGVMETFTARCVRQGTSPLHIVPAPASGAGTVLSDENGSAVFALTLVDSSVACAGGAAPVASATPSVAPTPTTKATGTVTRAAAAATLSISGPGAVQPLGTPFEITSNLSALALTETEPTWAGYGFELAYDASVIEIDSVVPNLCKPVGVWGNPRRGPHIVTGCFAQQQTSTGRLETITAKCLTDGTSPLHIVPFQAPGALDGTELFDENAVSAFALTLHDGSVTCAAGIAEDALPTKDAR